MPTTNNEKLDEEMRTRVAKAIQGVRGSRGLTQRECEIACRFQRTTWCQFEARHRVPSLRSIQRIVDGLRLADHEIVAIVTGRRHG